MCNITIKNIPELLQDYLGPKKHIIRTDLSPLIGPGENFSSIMLKLDVTLRDKDTYEENIFKTVAKILPASEIMKEILNVNATCKIEIAMYTEIFPTLRKFQKEIHVNNKINCIPEVYGARYNLNGSDEVDSNSCLVLENLHESGFTNISRSICFDLQTAQLVLRSLAEFHGVPLALKLKKPKVFEEKVKKNLISFRPNVDYLENFVRALLDQKEKFKSKFPGIKVFQKNPLTRESFATITHNDLWINNTMQKFVNGEPVENKFVDFQALDYGSLACDVFFYLFSSVQVSVLEKHLDNLLKYYHRHLEKILVEHGCDTKPFSYEAFLEELKIESKYEIGHAICFAALVRERQQNKEQDQLNSPPSADQILEDITEEGKKAAYYVAEICLERGWY